MIALDRNMKNRWKRKGFANEVQMLCSLFEINTRNQATSGSAYALLVAAASSERGEGK